MSLLGLSQNDFRAIEHAPSFEAGQQRLADFKERAKKQFRKAALELHPDRTNNDPAKTDDFKLVAAVADDIEKLVFGRPPPQPVMRAVRIVFRSVSHGSASTGTSTSTNYYGNGWGF